MRLSGCGAVGSARRSGRRGRWFESSHPDLFTRREHEVLLLSRSVFENAPLS